MSSDWAAHSSLSFYKGEMRKGMSGAQNEWALLKLLEINLNKRKESIWAMEWVSTIKHTIICKMHYAFWNEEASKNQSERGCNLSEHYKTSFWRVCRNSTESSPWQWGQRDSPPLDLPPRRQSICWSVSRDAPRSIWWSRSTPSTSSRPSSAPPPPPREASGGQFNRRIEISVDLSIEFSIDFLVLLSTRGVPSG